MFALSFCNLYLACLMKILGRSSLAYIVGKILGECISVSTIWFNFFASDSYIFIQLCAHVFLKILLRLPVQVFEMKSD